MVRWFGPVVGHINFPLFIYKIHSYINNKYTLKLTKPNQIQQTKPTKPNQLNLPYKSYQTKPTKPNQTKDI